MTFRQFFTFAIATTTLLFVSCGGDDNVPTGGDNPQPEQPEDKPATEAPFTIEVLDITATEARVSVSPDDKSAKYYFDILRELYYNEYNDKFGFQRFIDNTINGLMTSNSMTKEDVLKRILSSGDDSYGFTGLEAGSVYYAVAMGIDEDGKITTDIAVQKFSTTEVAPSTNVFDLSVGGTTYTGVSYDIKPSNAAEQYVLIPWNKPLVDQMSDAEFIKHCLAARSDIEEFIYTGNQSGVIDSCAPGRDYYLIAFGYEGGVATTGVTKVPFTTKSGGDPAACSFTFEVSSIEYDRAYMKVTPSAKHTVFFWHTVEKAYFNKLTAEKGEAEAMKDILKESLAPFAQDFGNIYDALEIISSYDDVSVEGTIYGLQQGTEYIPWAVCIDNHGEAAAAFVMGESFTTKADNIAECTVSVKGTFSEGSDGKAVLVSTVTPDTKCAGFYNVIFMGDLTDTPRQTMLNNLIRDDYFKNMNPCVFEKCPWNQTVTAVAVGYDTEGNFGPIAIDVFTPTK